jgi:iron complex outermembrane receptor protein
MRVLSIDHARHLGVAVALAAGLTRPLVAQSGSLQGRITDSSGVAIVTAVVSVDASNLRASPNSRGQYSLNGVAAGQRVVRVRALGFDPESLAVNVAGGSNTRLDITLHRAVQRLEAVGVVVGSHARHVAAEELAVPVDVYTAADIVQAGSTETSQVLANLSPSVNFPKQAVTDATEIVRPFTLRGLAPDHSLVLINGMRRHQTSLLNVFSNGSVPGSSGVDMNAFPSVAIDRLEVLRDGASTQYGSDAIAGVVNVVLKEGQFSPFINSTVGQYRPGDPYPNDGTTADVNGGVGLPLGKGSIALFGQVMNKEKTNRACPDGSFPDLNNQQDSVANCRVVIRRTNVNQPNVHWGDGAELDAEGFANMKYPLSADGNTEAYGFGGYSRRLGTGNGFFRKPQNSRNWSEIYPLGFLPEFAPDVRDYSAAGGIRTLMHGWATDLGAEYGFNSFHFLLRNTLNSSLGPSLTQATAPGLDGVLGTGDDPGIPNQTSFDAGQLKRGELNTQVNLSKEMGLGLPRPVNVAVGAAFRRESYQEIAGETASWIDGHHLTSDSSDFAQPGSSVFQGFAPSDASNNSRSNFGGYGELETNLTAKLLANTAARFEKYSDFGSAVTGKFAVRYQAARQFVLRGAVSNGFRAPGLQQSWYSHTTTAIINNVLQEIGNFPVTAHASRVFGAKPLKEENSLNFSGGMAWSPTPQLNITTDVYHIAIKNRIILGGTFDGTSDTVVARILADSINLNGVHIAGVQFPTNAADTKTDGVDVNANYRFEHVWRGALDVNGAFNYTKTIVTRVDGQPPILQGTASTFTSALDPLAINAIERNRPEDRASLTANYVAGRFHAMGRSSYYGSYVDGTYYLDLEKIPGTTLFDSEIGYKFDRVGLSFGINNLFNKFPKQWVLPDNTNNGAFPYPGSSPFGYNGRYMYVRSEMSLSR